MPWFYVDDGFSDSKPVLNLPGRHRLAACGLWVLTGSWSAKEETDGFVPDVQLRRLGSRPALVDSLTTEGPMEAPLWSRVEGGIVFNSWAKWQQTRAELEAKRRADAARQQKHRLRNKKGRNYVSGCDAEMSQCDNNDAANNEPEGVTRDVTVPLARARADPTRPDPTRPNNPLVTSRGGGLTQADAHDPRPQCPDHKTNHAGPCIHCRRRREWDEQHAEQAAADELATKRAHRATQAQAQADCPHCDDDGWLLGADRTPIDPATKCTAHTSQEHAHARPLR